MNFTQQTPRCADVHDASASSANAASPPVRSSVDLRTLAFTHCFLWTLPLLDELLSLWDSAPCSHRSLLRRLIERGVVRAMTVDVVPPQLESGPLWTSAERERTSAGAVAYRLEQRFARPSRPMQVFWPSPRFAAEQGRWTGAEFYHEHHKASHDLLVTAVWLRYAREHPEWAFHCWRSERYLRFQQAQQRGGESLPDALIQTPSRPRAIEIGGNYTAAWLRRHVERFDAAGWDWELW